MNACDAPSPQRTPLIRTELCGRMCVRIKEELLYEDVYSGPSLKLSLQSFTPLKEYKFLAGSTMNTCDISSHQRESSLREELFGHSRQGRMQNLLIGGGTHQIVEGGGGHLSGYLRHDLFQAITEIGSTHKNSADTLYKVFSRTPALDLDFLESSSRSLP